MALQATSFLQQYISSRPDVKHLAKSPDAVKLGIIAGSAMINAASIIHPVESHPGGRIIAVASRNLKDAHSTAKKYCIPTAYGSYADLLAYPPMWNPFVSDLLLTYIA